MSHSEALCVALQGSAETLNGHEVVVEGLSGGSMAVSAQVPLGEVGEMVCVACVKSRGWG